MTTCAALQILTHMREKLQFVMRSNKMLRKDVHALEDGLASKRDALAKVKSQRDKLRVGARSIKEGSLYIDNPMLLDDMKQQVWLIKAHCVPALIAFMVDLPPHG
jgi:histone deacetylase 6